VIEKGNDRLHTLFGFGNSLINKRKLEKIRTARCSMSEIIATVAALHVFLLDIRLLL